MGAENRPVDIVINIHRVYPPAVVAPIPDRVKHAAKLFLNAALAQAFSIPGAEYRSPISKSPQCGSQLQAILNRREELIVVLS
jgi:hypothetical protein